MIIRERVASNVGLILVQESIINIWKVGIVLALVQLRLLYINILKILQKFVKAVMGIVQNAQNQTQTTIAQVLQLAGQNVKDFWHSQVVNIHVIYAQIPQFATRTLQTPVLVQLVVGLYYTIMFVIQLVQQALTKMLVAMLVRVVVAAAPALTQIVAQTRLVFYRTSKY